MRIRSDVDRIKSLVITEPGESDHWGEMMKAFFRTEKSRFPVADYTEITAAGWRAKRRAILRGLKAALGPMPERKVPLKAKTGRRIDRGEYTLEGVSFYTRSDWPVSALLYLPKHAKRPLPAVLLVHGHSYIQKAATVYQQVAAHLAREGYAVLAVDFVGGGEREPQGHKSRYLWLAGMTVQGVMAWDNMRAVDYLLTRRDIDPGRIGITGSSGGGNQAAYTMILDERIAAAAPVNAPVMFDEHLTVGVDAACSCEVVPGAWTFAEYSDLLATVAPRPLLLSQAAKDRLFPVAGVREIYYRAREVYKALGAADAIEMHEDYGPHSYAEALRIGVIRWFDRHLKALEPRPFEEYRDFITVEDERSEALHAFPGGKLPKGTITLAQLFARETRQLPETRRPRTKAAYRAYRRATLAHLGRLAGRPADNAPLAMQAYPPAQSSWARVRPFSFESERGIIIPSILVEPLDAEPSRVVIFASPAGKARAVQLRTVERLVCAGAAVVAPDLRGYGETLDSGPGTGPDFILNRSALLGRHISMLRAFDIRRTVDAVLEIADLAGLPVSLWAEGEASMPGLYAFALDGRMERLAATDLLLTFKSDAGFAQADAVLTPGILKAADVADVVAAALGRKILLAQPELPSGAKVSLPMAQEVLAPAMAAARAAALAAPEIAAGGYEAASEAVARFLLE